jgi:geranyl-CoA carboxylase alpha subunit
VKGPENAFDKILIANRGEIACRIMRTAHAMGYETVAVFSDADADALHVKMAGEAVHIGASPAAESYLNARAIIGAAKKSGASAIHPGYGFLAENADFAAACDAAGIVFVGPPAEVIRTLGDKARAKAIAAAAGAPCVPGYTGEDQSSGRLQSEAATLGFPLLIKAVAGGGGRGIRAVASAGVLHDELEAARREAAAAFGDGRLMLEKLIEEPRHIEVQIFGDAHGNVVHLFERDCTTQRRRQKIIEEAPSPALTGERRERITSYAVAIAQRAGYQNAGTVEFIADRNGNIYFLEVNTRLQVEHPVTELLTGLDLVEWQLRVAAGKPLPLTQDQIERTGHAIEVRLCAEDPADGFRPQTGDVIFWRPETAAGVRVDSGIAEGGCVSPFYDSMIAKVISHGQSRAEAIRKLRFALKKAPLLGLATNQAFLSRLVHTAEFANATLSTASLDRWSQAGHEIFGQKRPSPETVALAAALFANGSRLPLGIDMVCGGEEMAVRYRSGGDGASVVETESSVQELTIEDRSFPGIAYCANGVRRRAIAVLKDCALHVSCDGESFTFTERNAAGGTPGPDDDGIVRAPVAGRIAKVFVREGEALTAGTGLAVIEAMKMEIRVTSPRDGVVASLFAVEGGQVAQGGILCEIEKAGIDHG